ncbi:MAG: HdeD family acid-resistance protein [Chloroflexi bacterium]|nr:HdeD family acid-resistance protein [Chloroflexota bacterium]
MFVEAGVVPRHWWTFALRGAAAIAFGILAFAWPGLTVASLVLLFGAFSLVNGVMTIISAIRRTATEHVWLLLLEGVLGIIAGLAVFTWPGITALILLYWIAAWAIVTGVMEAISAVRLRNTIHHEWSWIVSGALSVIFGLILLARPGAGAVAIAWMIGIYAVLFGISLLVVAWRIHDLDRSEHGHPGSAGIQQPVSL